MVLEVKNSVPLDFYKIHPQNECIELLIYCLYMYIMRLHLREVMLRALTDRKAWQILN